MLDSIGGASHNGIAIQTDLSATSGILNLDADFDDTADSIDTITIAPQVTVLAETLLTFEVHTGEVIPAGDLTLVGGSGIVLLNSVRSTGTGTSNMVINADADSDGDGTLTVVASELRP